MWDNNNAGKLSSIADHCRIRDQHIVFQAILNWLGSDEFAAACLKQVLFAISDFKKPIGIDLVDIFGFELLFLKCLFGLCGILLILLEYRRFSH